MSVYKIQIYVYIYILDFIPLGLAGPPLPALDRRGPRRTSTGEILSAVGLAGLQPASRSAVGLAGPQPTRFGALWALPDLNRRDSARRGPRRTSTGPQRPEIKPYRMPKRMPDRMSEDIPDRMSEDMPDRMSEDMTDRMPEDMTDRMPEDMTDRMPEDMPDGMPNRYAR